MNFLKFLNFLTFVDFGIVSEIVKTQTGVAWSNNFRNFRFSENLPHPVLFSHPGNRNLDISEFSENSDLQKFLKLCQNLRTIPETNFQNFRNYSFSSKTSRMHNSFGSLVTTERPCRRKRRRAAVAGGRTRPTPPASRGKQAWKLPLVGR